MYYLLALIVTVVVLTYKWFVTNWKYWDNVGLVSMKPIFPFGSSPEIFYGRVAYSDIQIEIYNSFKKSRLFGIYIARLPVLIVSDPGLVNRLLINDYGHFSERGFKDADTLDPLSATNLVNVTTDRWRTLRNNFAPGFSVSKLKSLHQRIIECCHILADRVENSRPTLSVKELTGEFSLNLMGYLLLSIPSDHLVDPRSAFKTIIQETFKNTFLINIRTLCRYLCPGLLEFFKWKRFSRKEENFFIDFVKRRVEHQTENNGEINDIFQHFIGPPSDNGDISSRLKGVTMTELAANTYGMFAAGVETTGSVLAYTLYELAKNQVIQEKLHKEITSVLLNHDNEPTYAAIKEMKYLDQVLSESLRMYPSLQGTSRMCTKDYKIPDSDVVIEKGIKVIIPIIALHHDPEYFPDPYTFNPDRFSDENKVNIVKGSYIPFGDGPRICIGQRLAKMEIKVALVTLLTKYTFKVNKKMIQPLTFSPRAIFLVPKHPILLDVIPRTNS